MSDRKLAFIAPMSWIALGLVVLAMPLVLKVEDEFGLLFSFAFGVAGLVVGGLQLWRLNKDDPKTTAYTVDDLPLKKRVHALRRLILMFAAAIIAGTLMTTYALVQLEHAGAERAAVWAPVAGVYSALGFWPAVLVFPALGLSGIAVMWHRLRIIRSAASAAAEPR